MTVCKLEHQCPDCKRLQQNIVHLGKHSKWSRCYECAVKIRKENNMERGTIECTKHGDTLRVVNSYIECAACIVEREIKLSQATVKRNLV